MNADQKSLAAQANDMADCVCFRLRAVDRRLTQVYERAVRPAGIKPTQLPILAGLAGRDAASMAGLSEWLGMDRTTLLRNLRPLERDGLVRRRREGRSNALEITDMGRRLLGRVHPLWSRAQREVLATLGQERWGKIFRDLEVAAGRLG